jgi:hypothetical protein
MTLVKITSSELKELKERFKIDWPLHVITYNTLENFIERFAKFPEWEEKVTFWSLNGDQSFASFVMINAHTDSIFFNTLESEPYTEVKSILQLIEYTDKMVFLNVRSIFQQLVKDVMKKLKMQLTYEGVFNCFLMPKERFKNLEIEYVNKLSLSESYFTE